MEINTQQIETLLHLQEQQAQLPRRPQGQTAQGFDALLNQQLENVEQSAAFDPAIAGNAALYNQIKLNQAEANQPLDADAALLQAAFDQASGALDMWDSYTQALGSSTASGALRDAYSLLEGIDQQVAQLRSSQAAGKSEALDEIINELEVLSATEKFKFNRGDYLA